MYYRVRIQGQEYRNAMLVGGGLNRYVLVCNGMYEAESKDVYFHASNVPSYVRIAGVYA